MEWSWAESKMGTIEGRWRKEGTDHVRPWEGFPVSFWDKKLLGNDEN